MTADTTGFVAPDDVTESDSAVRSPQSPRARLATDDQGVSDAKPAETPQSAPNSAHTESDEEAAPAASGRTLWAPVMAWLASRDIRLPRVMTEPREPLLAVVDRRRREIDQRVSGVRWWVEMGWINTFGAVSIFVLYLLAWVQEDIWRSIRVTAVVLTVGQILHSIGGRWIPLFLTWQYWPPVCWFL